MAHRSGKSLRAPGLNMSTRLNEVYLAQYVPVSEKMEASSRDLDADGKNLNQLICVRCKSKILPPGAGTFTVGYIMFFAIWGKLGICNGKIEWVKLGNAGEIGKVGYSVSDLDPIIFLDLDPVLKIG